MTTDPRYPATDNGDGTSSMRAEDYERLLRDAGANGPPPFESMLRRRPAAGAERGQWPDHRAPWMRAFDRPGER